MTGAGDRAIQGVTNAAARLSSRMASERSDAARNARAAVAIARGHERSGIEQNRISAPYPGAALAIVRW